MHNIRYDTFLGEVSLKTIEKDIVSRVQNIGDRYGTDHLRMPTNDIFVSEDAAVKYIENIDRGDFDGIAVKFFDLSQIKDTKKVANYRAKLNELWQKKSDYIAAHSVHKQRATYIGCRECGSKLNKEKLKGEHCPLCGTDLRAASTLEHIASFDKRREELFEKIKEEQLKQKDKAPIRWLVKYEFHS